MTTTRITNVRVFATGVDDRPKRWGLNKRAKDSEAMLEFWDLTDCIIEGAKAVREQGQKYLPKFADEDEVDYRFRSEKAVKYTNVYRDIVEGLASKPFENEVGFATGENASEPPEDIKTFVEDVDGAGNNLTSFAGTVFFNGINSAIDWIFVDYPSPDPDVIRTKQDEKQAGIRPFWSHVLGRNVLEAKVRVIQGKETLTYMRILEPGIPEQIREFVLDDAGIVRWSLWEQVEKSAANTIGEKEYVQIATGIITIGVIPLVPFFTGRRNGRTFKFYPAMRDAADLQIELYQQESALKYAKILTAYPMLSANGVRPPKDGEGKPKKLAVGPNRVLYAEPDGTGNVGSFSYVEISATSLVFLQSDIDKTKEALRELGKQPLTAQSSNLTTISAAAAAGKAKSAVGQWALKLKDAIENALVLTCMWLNISTDEYDPEITIDMDWDTGIDSSADQATLSTMREKGDLSQETYWYEMKRRRVLSPEFDADTERERLLDEQPGGGFEDNPNPVNEPVLDPVTGLPVDPQQPALPLPKSKPKPQPGA